MNVEPRQSPVAATNQASAPSNMEKVLIWAKRNINADVLSYIDPHCELVGLEASKPRRSKKARVTLQDIDVENSSAQNERMAPNVSEKVRRAVDYALAQPPAPSFSTSSSTSTPVRIFFDFNNSSAWGVNKQIFVEIFQKVIKQTWPEGKNLFNLEMARDAFKARLVHMINARFHIIYKRYQDKLHKSVTVRSAYMARAVLTMRKKRVSERV